MTDTEPAPSLSSIYDYLFRSTSDGILLLSAQNIFTRINPAAAALLGITVEDVLGKTPAQCFHQNPALLNLIIRKGDQTLDVRLPRRRLAVGLASTLDTNERIVLLHDITEKRDLENRREALIKAIAHDLRNPVSAIGGFADLVGKFGELNAPQEKFLTRIQQTTSKLHDMAEHLVDLSWIEAGMPLAHVPIRLDIAINKAVEELSGIAKTNKVGIATSLQTPLPPVMGDPERFHMVIYHLLHNGIVYSEPENNVVIHAWGGDDLEVYVSVADQGIGIADDELEMIFDRMYRSRDERVQKVPGGGFGLTLARTIIKRHGGDIWAASNLNEGSTVTFVMPSVQVQI